MLNPEFIKTGLSNFGLDATGTHFVYRNLTLEGKCIDDITPLATYIYLEDINLSKNNIKDLLALGSMKYLNKIDASYNSITMLLNFKAPIALKIVDFSNNQICHIPNMCSYKYLQYISLSNNKISIMEGLQSCCSLSYIDLSFNCITEIQGLDFLPIKYLNLSHNSISNIENLESLEKLEKIILSYNNIRSMAGLEYNSRLDTIDISNNELIDLSEINHLTSLCQLRKLFVKFNPMMIQIESRLSIIFKLQNLEILDNEVIDPEDKVAAVNLFNPSMKYEASRDHMMHAVYSFMRPNFVLDMTLPSLKMNYPIMILVGPQGMSKTWLSQKLVQDFPEHFAFALSCTTRSPRSEEKNNIDYYFISLEEFEMLIKTGQFIQTTCRHNELYGTTIQSIETVAKEALACVLRMELEGVLSLKQTALKPLCVYVLPKNLEGFEARLISLGHYTTEQIADVIKRVQLYMEHIKHNLTANDAVIIADNPLDVYKELKDLVQCFLSVRPTSSCMQTENLHLADRQCVSAPVANRTNSCESNININNNEIIELPVLTADPMETINDLFKSTNQNHIKSSAYSLPMSPRQSSTLSSRPYTAPPLSLDLNSITTPHPSASSNIDLKNELHFRYGTSSELNNLDVLTTRPVKIK